MGNQTPQTIVDALRKCPHQQGFDPDLGPVGCILPARGLQCVCEGIAHVNAQVAKSQSLEAQKRVDDLDPYKAVEAWNRRAVKLHDALAVAWKPGDKILWGTSPNDHVWRVLGVHLGAAGTESIIEIENVSHKPGWTGEWETHQLMFVPECLLRQCQRVTDTAGKADLSGPDGVADGAPWWADQP